MYSLSIKNLLERKNNPDVILIFAVSLSMEYASLQIFA